MKKIKLLFFIILYLFLTIYSKNISPSEKQLNSFHNENYFNNEYFFPSTTAFDGFEVLNINNKFYIALTSGIGGFDSAKNEFNVYTIPNIDPIIKIKYIGKKI